MLLTYISVHFCLGGWSHYETNTARKSLPQR